MVIANRLPVDRVIAPTATAVAHLPRRARHRARAGHAQSNGGAWIGWHGAADEKLEPFEHDGMQPRPGPAARDDEVEEYYEGFSNATLWPLYHDVVAPPEFHREWWDSYVAVNRRFAEKAAAVAETTGAVVWVQDYQLQLVPTMLRELRPDLRIGFFLHIPFPPTELFQQLPWRRRDPRGPARRRPRRLPDAGGAAQNFVRLVRQRVGHKTHRDTIYLPDGRTVLAKAYPISIDAAGFEELARTPEVSARAAEIRESLGNPKTSCSASTGSTTPRACASACARSASSSPEGSVHVDDAVFVQVATPSRERVEQYSCLRDDINRLVGRINGDVGRIGQQPDHLPARVVPAQEMAALYRAADVMVVTPLRDGMNLVAKEYVACRYDDRGALVLSEFAGAAAELKQAYLVNPYDINGMKATMLEAISDPPGENDRADEGDAQAGHGERHRPVGHTTSSRSSS